MTSPAIGSFAGLGSGINYKSIVDQIIQVDSLPGTVIQARIDKANAKIGAYKTYSSLLTSLEAAASPLRDGSAFEAATASVSGGTSASGRTLLSASASAGAAPGSYAVQVLQTAQAEKLSGATFASGSTALGLVGEFLINGKAITIAAVDTLASVRDKINSANTGASASGVTAAVVTDSTNAQRIVLTSQKTGAGGINLVDGSQSIARQLGWVDSTSSIKNPTSAGALSDKFASSSATIASQLGLTLVPVPGPQTVTVGTQTVSIDLGADSLSSIAAKLSGLTGIQATVQTSTVNGASKYYLDVRNTTSFVDAGNTLEQLGILTSGRSAVAQQVLGAPMTAGDASTPATASTLLSTLWNGGSASGAKAGDTLSITGKRGDGSAVNVAFAIGASSTVQDLLTALNDPTTGFGAGTRPATASIDASGRIAVSDGTAGQSSLSLQIVANNQGGGRLDFGTFANSTTGRARQLVAGTDAKFSVDGVSFTRSSNTVSDVIADTTLSLTAADPTATAVVTIDRSVTAAQTAAQGYVDSYNKLVDFIQLQQTPGADPTKNQILYNDSVLRQARSALSGAMLATVAGAAPDLSTAAMAGISLTKDGHLALDANKFQTAYTTRFDDVEKLFVERGTSTNPAMAYASSTAATKAGTYAVNVTQAARQGRVLGAGFSGVYADDATPDTISVTDLSSNTAAQVQLSNGMTTAQIVAAMNSAFGTAQVRTLQASTTLNDASGTVPATAATRIVDLKLANASPAGAVVGDSIGYSGVRSDGTAYNGSFTVGAGSTVADLVTQMQASLGSADTVSFVNGQLNVKTNAAGMSKATLTVTPNNAGGGQLSFGTMDATNPGRNALSLTATAVGNQIQIQSNAYGATSGAAIAFTGGGTNSTAQLGIPVGAALGADVQGTIGGYAATGTGQLLVGATGTPVDGLSLAYSAAATGAIGSVSFTQGTGALVDRLLTSWNQTGGTVSSQTTALSDQVSTQQKRLDDFNVRMEIRRAALMKEYLAMDTAVQKFQAQGAAFAGTFGQSSSGTGTSTGHP